MADFWRDFWIRETGTGQQVTQIHDRYDDDDDDDEYFCFNSNGKIVVPYFISRAIIEEEKSS